MTVYLARIAAGLLGGLFAGLVSYLVYRRYEEAKELINRLLYRPLGIPEEESTFRRRTYLILMSVTGLVFGFFFEALRMGNLLERLHLHIQNLTFFAFSIGLSLALFQILLYCKVENVSKEMVEQWLIIGLVFGFFLGLFFNLVSFFLIGPLML